MSIPVESIGNIYTCRSCQAHKLCLPDCLDDFCPTDTQTHIVKQQRFLQRGDYLFRAGDDFRAIHAICNGSLKTCRVNSDGAVQITGFYVVGELVGMNGIEKKKHRLDAIALEPTTVCEILYSHLFELSDREPMVMRNLLDVMASHISSNQNELMTVVGNRNASESLASFLCALSRRYARDGEYKTEFCLTMSRNDISNYLGLAKETVSRLFAKLEQDGLIAFHQKQIKLLDLTKLKRLAGQRELSPSYC